MTEAPLMKLSMRLDPEAMAMLRPFVERLKAMESELKEIRRSFAEALHKLFEIQELPPGLGEPVVGKLDTGPAPAGD